MAPKSQKAADVVKNVEEQYGFGCYTEKNPEDCDFLARFLQVKQYFEKASRLFRLNCDKNRYGYSCYEAGNFFLRDKTKGHVQQAYDYYEKGCRLNDRKSCYYAGLLLTGKLFIPGDWDQNDYVERNMPKGMEYIHKSCELNHVDACLILMKLYKSRVQEYEKLDHLDIFTSKNKKKSFEYAYKSCKLRDLSGCLNLSEMYAKGYGTEENQEKSERASRLAEEIASEEQSIRDFPPSG